MSNNTSDTPLRVLSNYKENPPQTPASAAPAKKSREVNEVRQISCDSVDKDAKDDPIQFEPESVSAAAWAEIRKHRDPIRFRIGEADDDVIRALNETGDDFGDTLFTDLFDTEAVRLTDCIIDKYDELSSVDGESFPCRILIFDNYTDIMSAAKETGNKYIFGAAIFAPGGKARMRYCIPIMCNADGVHYGGVCFEYPDAAVRKKMLDRTPFNVVLKLLVNYFTTWHGLQLALNQGLDDFIEQFIVDEGVSGK